jgi:hypothetical protein
MRLGLTLLSLLSAEHLREASDLVEQLSPLVVKAMILLPKV